MPIEILVAVVGGVTGLVGMVVAIWQAATAGRAERSSSAAAITTAASELVDDLHNELQRLKQSVDERDNELQRLKKRVSDLEKTAADQQGRIARLQRELDQAEQRIRALEQENTCLREENARLAQVAGTIRVVTGVGTQVDSSIASSPSPHSAGDGTE